MVNTSKYESWIGIMILTVLPLGCEENLAPREHYDAVPFSLYGVLSPDLDTQSVRLYPIEDFPTLGLPEPPDVEVTSTDLQTGEQRTWRDSVIVEPNGQHEYVFWSPFRAEFDHTYRVEVVRRADGERSYADVRIPLQVTVQIDNTTRPLALLDVYIEGEDFRALKPEAVYDVFKPGLPVLQYKISYQGREQPVEQGWHVTFNMIVDAYDINYLYNGEIPTRGGECRVDFVALKRLQLHLLVGDPVWDPPGGVFDPNDLSFPQTLSNVENGFGFIGGGYRISPSLFPSRESVEAACFVYAL